MPKHNIATIMNSLNKGATFAGIDVLTQTKVNKSLPNDDRIEVDGKIPARIYNPHFGNVQKTNVGGSVIIGADYQTMVRKHLAEQFNEESDLVDELRSQGKMNAAKAVESNLADPLDFVVSERKWGTTIPGTQIVEHKGEHYISMIYRKSGETVYRVSGKVVDKDEILGMPASRPNPGSQGGADKKVDYRTIKLDSITALRIGGKSYVGSFYYDPETA